MVYDHAAYHRRSDVRKKKKESTYAWRLRNPEKWLYRSAMYRARYRGIPFDIDIDDIVIPAKCPILEVPLTTDPNLGSRYSNASLDRIDNTKGYVKGNVRVISRLANMMKNEATAEQLKLFAKNIEDYLS
jgi:hypothetical protein